MCNKQPSLNANEFAAFLGYQHKWLRHRTTRAYYFPHIHYTRKLHAYTEAAESMYAVDTRYTRTLWHARMRRFLLKSSPFLPHKQTKRAIAENVSVYSVQLANQSNSIHLPKFVDYFQLEFYKTIIFCWLLFSKNQINSSLIWILFCRFSFCLSNFRSGFMFIWSLL